MTLATDEFTRRFLLHVLPRDFHRIRRYGLLAGGSRKDCLAPARGLACRHERSSGGTRRLPPAIPVLRRAHIVIEVFERCGQPREPPGARTTNREIAP